MSIESRAEESVETESGAPAPNPESPASATPAIAPNAKNLTSDFLGKVNHVDRFNFDPVTNIEPGTQLAERYRALRSSLQTLNAKRGVASLLITSCYHAEGKTVSSINLARYLAKNVGKKVVLVDCDLRKPRVRHFLNQDCPLGLEDALQGKTTIHKVTTFSYEDNLAVISTRRGHSNATELLDAPIMDRFLEELKAAFDYVIVDCSPVLSTSDPIVVGRKLDGALVAVRAGHTQRESVEHMLDLLQQAEVRVHGVVLTFMRDYIPKSLSRYQYYQDYSYHATDR